MESKQGMTNRWDNIDEAQAPGAETTPSSPSSSGVGDSTLLILVITTPTSVFHTPEIDPPPGPDVIWTGKRPLGKHVDESCFLAARV